MAKRVCFVLSLLMIFSVISKGQKISGEFCKNVEISVIEPLNPTKIDRREVYSDECVFEFTVEKKIDVSLRIQKYNTEKESKLDIEKTLSIFSVDYIEEDKQLPLENLETADKWDNAYFHKSESNSFILLRKNCFKISMFSQKSEYLLQMEKRLQKINFGGYQEF